MLRMPLEIQRIDTPPHDILAASGAAVSKEDLVVGLAVQPGFVFEEFPFWEGGQALDADEAVWVPLLVGRRDHLGGEGLAADCAGLRHCWERERRKKEVKGKRENERKNEKKGKEERRKKGGRKKNEEGEGRREGNLVEREEGNLNEENVCLK